MAGVKAIIVLCIIFITDIESARILAYFPTPSISHQVIFRPITQELAKRGHEVIVVTPNPFFTKGKTLSNLTEIGVHEVSYENWKQVLINNSGKKTSVLAQAIEIFERLATIFDLQMQTPVVQDMLKDKGENYFDIILLEACHRPVLAFAHKFKAPVVLISSLGVTSVQYAELGAPSHPFLYPTLSRQRSYNLTFWEKLLELFKLGAAHLLLSYTEKYDTYIAKKNFGDDLPTFGELNKRIKMMLINEHPMWADNHPVPPSIQYIGGIHQNVEKELPEDLQRYLNSSKQGVIYVSFGTNIIPSLLPPEFLKVIIKVFSELPYNILWVSDKEMLPEQSKNIYISSWVPQADVLRHPNVKLFVTQGGLQSTDEAIDAGVPLVGIPMMADQWYNVEKYVRHQIGVQLDIKKMTEENFKEAIMTVIGNKSYKENILRLKSLMRSFPVKPLVKAIYWIEHIMTYGGEHLQSPAAHKTLIEYYEVKLIITGIILIVFSLILVAYLIKQIYNLASIILRTNIKIKLQ